MFELKNRICPVKIHGEYNIGGIKSLQLAQDSIPESAPA